jgi:hypothetical protein
MASMISKTISKHTAYYLVESARVGGKPRIVSQRYLGKASDIEAAIDGATMMPDRLDPPPKTTRAVVPVVGKKESYFLEWRSSSAPKNDAAALRISLACLSSLIS